MLCVCVCVSFSNLKKFGMKFISVNSPEPHISKFPTIANNTEDAQNNEVGMTTAPPSIEF
jgi:hypothetical protein